MSESKPNIAVIGPANLRVKCLCGCGGIQTYEGVTLTLEAVFDIDYWEFSHYKVRFSCDLYPHASETYTRVQVRGEIPNAVFALPCAEYKPGGVWVSKPDRDGSHYAVKRRGA